MSPHASKIGHRPVEEPEAAIQSILVSFKAAEARKDFIAMLDGYEVLGNRLGLFNHETNPGKVHT